MLRLVASFPLFFLFLAVSFQTISYASEYLVLSATQQVVEGGDAGPVTKIEVRVGSKQVVVLNARAEKYYDFEADQLIIVDRAQGSYQVTPLASLVAFRALELQNRLKLSATLEASGLKNPMGDLFQLESTFGLLSNPDRSPDLRNVAKDDGEQILYKDVEVVQYKLRANEIPKQLQASYNRFLLYELALHPSIRQRMSNEQRVLSKLSYSVWTPKQIDQRVNLAIDEVALMSNEGLLPMLDALDRQDVLAPQLSTILNDESLADRAPSLTEFQEQFENQIASGDNVSAFLTMIESSWVHDSMVDPSKVDLTDFRQDEDVQALGHYSANGRGVEPDKSIAVLSALRDKTIVPRSAISVLIANKQAEAGNLKTAIDEMTSALLDAPYYVGAWHDLGGFYFSAFEMQKAWACFEQARRLNTDHQLLSGINRFEAQLRARHPEYF